MNGPAAKFPRSFVYQLRYRYGFTPLEHAIHDNRDADAIDGGKLRHNST
jgi:hypothetical protein